MGIVVDYIVPMVFHDDKSWQDSFSKVGRWFNDVDLPSFVRYRSWGTEHVLIKLIKKNMPWIRNIYIILSSESQFKEWMNDEGVFVVYHKDFIPDKYLPLFNSRAIEMFLKDIPGLSEYFIYGNDDMFPLSPLEQSDFFKNGVPCLKFSEKPFPDTPNNFHLACKNGLNFVAGFFGKEYKDTTIKLGHSIVPIKKSTCEKIWEIGGDRIEKSITPFREICNFNQYIYSWYQFFSGQYVEKAPKRVYTSVRKPLADVLSVINADNAGIVCVNDNECVSEYMQYGTEVKKALEEKLK